MIAGRSLTACLVLLLCASTNAQDCPSTPGGILQDADLASYDGCAIKRGDLVIGSRDCSVPCQVTTLAPLSRLQSVLGTLSISCCPDLTAFDGLGNLASVTSIDLYYNPNVTEISGFLRVISTTGYVRISQHPSLATISGFSSLQRIGSYLQIDRNPTLTDARGFGSIHTIGGDDTIAGNSLTIIYNTALTDLSFLASLTSISYGTVQIEGNIALCYAGYPQWGGDGQFSSRTGSATEDKGLDWRPFLSPSNRWQYTWGVDGGGYPSLVIQNNAPADSCGAASCHSSCMTNAGCLGPNDPNTCGSCTVVGGVNPCEITSPPAAAPAPIGIILGVVLSIVGVVILVLLALGIWGCVVVGKRYHDLRQGSFDISVESGVQLRSNSQAAQQIASMTEPTFGSSVTRQGVKYQPKLDSVVISSYNQSTDGSDERTSSRNSYSGQRSSIARDELPSAGKARTSRSLASRPQSEVSVSGKRISTSSLSEGMAKEPSTEDILQRLREENAEIPMNFPWDSVKLGKELGTGDFGKVFHAEARKLLPGQRKSTIMVKQLKDGATKEERETFLRPVEAMKVLQHPNVLSLVGVSMKGPSIYVMLEYCSQGNFKTFLVRKRRESMGLKQNDQLIRMAIDMAAGLDYLHSKNIAHNDFAARSCLVTGDSKIKLGDYGITRQTFKEDYYARKPNQKALPIRWMAPEVIIVQGRNMLDSLPVSLPSNIWSFGVALWEICSFAQWPYDDLSNEEVLQTLKTSGKCILENPLEPSDRIAPLFDICESCWQPADLRPSMGEILERLQELLKNGSITERKPSTSAAAPVKRVSQGQPPAMRPKSQSFQPPPHKDSSNEDTLKRNANTGKPRRPAPTKPAPSRPSNTSSYPRSRGRLDSQEEPLVISNSASQDDDFGMKKESFQGNGQGRAKKEMIHKKTESTEKLISDSLPKADERGTKKAPRSTGNGSKPTDKSKSISRQDPSAPKKKKKQGETSSERRIKRSIPLSVVPDSNKSELPLPQEMKEALQEEKAMDDNEDDFILEPPPKFSQEDDLEKDELRGAVGGAASGPGLHFEELSDDEDTTYYDTEKRYESNIQRKIREKQDGGSKVLNRKNTPASLTVAESKAVAEELGIGNPSWESDEEDYLLEASEDMFSDDFDGREAMEEDELPNVVLEEDVAALIW